MSTAFQLSHQSTKAGEMKTKAMDLTDERLHRRTVPWTSLVMDGYDPKEVLLEAQRQGLHKLARSAQSRIENTKRNQQ